MAAAMIVSVKPEAFWNSGCIGHKTTQEMTRVNSGFPSPFPLFAPVEFLLPVFISLLPGIGFEQEETEGTEGHVPASGCCLGSSGISFLFLGVRWLGYHLSPRNHRRQRCLL